MDVDLNSTNWRHMMVGAAIQLGAGIPASMLGIENALWITGAFAGGFFLSREHAHRQVDIRAETGVAVPKQNPIKGFFGWSNDAKLDFWPTAILVLAIAGLGGVFGL